MTTAIFIKKPKRLRRMHEGPLGVYMDLFAARLLQEGHCQQSAWRNIRVVGDLQDQFIQHHRCCATLGMTCQAPWFNMNPMGEAQVNCDGAQAIVDFWYARLKESLLGNDFQCP